MCPDLQCTLAQGSGIGGVSDGVVASAANLQLWLRSAQAVQAALGLSADSASHTPDSAMHKNASEQATAWNAFAIHALLVPGLRPKSPQLLVRSKVSISGADQHAIRRDSDQQTQKISDA